MVNMQKTLDGRVARLEYPDNRTIVATYKGLEPWNVADVLVFTPLSILAAVWLVVLVRRVFFVDRPVESPGIMVIAFLVASIGLVSGGGSALRSFLDFTCRYRLQIQKGESRLEFRCRSIKQVMHFDSKTDFLVHYVLFQTSEFGLFYRVCIDIVGEFGLVRVWVLETKDLNRVLQTVAKIKLISGARGGPADGGETPLPPILSDS